MLEPSELFYCVNKDTYPPFKNGLYMEEYFIKKYLIDKPNTNRKYIPLPWTNFQIATWFNIKKNILQDKLDEWIKNNPSDFGYFTIVQYDDGPLLKLPIDTVIYGACSGNIPIPLIYEDKDKKLLSGCISKSFKDKNILCSFVGSITHTLRKVIIETYKNNTDFYFSITNGWDPNVNIIKQDNFINISYNSKFGLAPRGYGRSSFRFFELLNMGIIPVYVWDDIEWLPYKENIDYNKFCISINISDINKLYDILLSIDENKYNIMLDEYNKVKDCFSLDGMYNYIIENVDI